MRLRVASMIGTLGTKPISGNAMYVAFIRDA